MTRRGGAGKGSGSKGCRGAEHGQACTKELTGAVAVRAALESAVQVGRSDEGNRQAEMANPTKCGDSLQLACDQTRIRLPRARKHELAHLNVNLRTRGRVQARLLVGVVSPGHVKPDFCQHFPCPLHRVCTCSPVQCSQVYVHIFRLFWNDHWLFCCEMCW
jgi:hypothetical protein